MKSSGFFLSYVLNRYIANWNVKKNHMLSFVLKKFISAYLTILAGGSSIYLCTFLIRYFFYFFKGESGIFSFFLRISGIFSAKSI